MLGEKGKTVGIVLSDRELGEAKKLASRYKHFSRSAILRAATRIGLAAVAKKPTLLLEKAA